MIDIIFPFHGLLSPLQIHDLGSIPSGWVIWTGEVAHLIVGHWHQPGSGCCCILPAPCKIHSSSVHVISATSCNIQLTAQIIFPPRLNLEVHTRSPSSSPTKYTQVLGQRQSHKEACLFPWEEKSTLTFPLPYVCRDLISSHSEKEFHLGRTRVVTRSPRAD